MKESEIRANDLLYLASWSTCHIVRSKIVKYLNFRTFKFSITTVEHDVFPTAESSIK